MIKLLIVDDSNIIRSRIERIYEKKSSMQIVGKAQNGIEAFEMAQKLKPDLITMDLTMPEMDGVSCIEKIIEFDPSARILVVSALSDVATGLSAIKKGARGFLCKPFTDEEMLNSINEVINT